MLEGKQVQRLAGKPGREARKIMDVAKVFRSIGIDKDYSGMNFDGLQLDLQGWGSAHAVFRQVFAAHQPGLVIEVGTWKGASVAHMAELSKSLGLGTKFICVDTWLGSNDTLWIRDDFRQSLMLQHGYPTMFRQFIFNIRERGIVDDVFPLPMTSTAGAHLLKRLGVVADVIYIDAGHEEEEVLADLNLYYQLLRPGGGMFGDDYVPQWPGVIRAVDRFCAEKGLTLSAARTKWSFAKPEAP